MCVCVFFMKERKKENRNNHSRNLTFSGVKIKYMYLKRTISEKFDFKLDIYYVQSN